MDLDKKIFELNKQHKPNAHIYGSFSGIPQLIRKAQLKDMMGILDGAKIDYLKFGMVIKDSEDIRRALVILQKAYYAFEAGKRVKK